MLAVRLHQDGLRLEEIATPSAGVGEVLVGLLDEVHDQRRLRLSGYDGGESGGDEGVRLRVGGPGLGMGGWDE